VKRALVALLLAAAGPAAAQTADALGKPLASPDMAQGTLSVRVIAGSPQNAVIGTDVTLLVNGNPRVARTDSAGRAHFKDLPIGAQLQAKVLDDDKKEVVSDPFKLPDGSGARLMLTTRPWNPTGPAMRGGGAGSGEAGMPNPRQMSGEPRAEGADTPGTYIVRLSYDDFKDPAPPAGVPVTLVGYNADNSVVVFTRNSEKDGRATFAGLDRSGATAYFAMTLLPRGTGVDRLTSTPAVLDSRGGVRLILSGEKRDAAGNLDDLTRVEKQDGAPPAGKVRVAIEGGVDPTQDVVLIDAATKLQLGRGKPRLAPPDPSDVKLAANFEPKTDIPAGMVVVTVQGGPTGSRAPLPDVLVKITPVKQGVELPGAKESQTTDQGTATFQLEPVGEYTATITINGKPITTGVFELAKSGGAIDAQASWDTQGKPEVVFDLIPRVGQVVYSETVMHGQLYRTVPFQPVADRGTRVTLFVFPRILFSFSLTSRVDDEYIAVNGRFEVSNNSWIPWVSGPDGLILPLPKGFVGGLVAEKDQGDVALEPTQGYRIARPIAPGRRQFHGAFSIPVEDGKATWRMDLPFGAFNSGMEILMVPGMHVHPHGDVKGEEMVVPQGTYFVLPQISIMPRQSMVMTLTGLPSPPAWKVWLPRIVGVLVILLVAGGVCLALFRKSSALDSAARDARRQALLDELVQLERDGSGGGKRKAQIRAELEQLWDDSSPPSPTS
jgi:hypothetical protein